MKPKVYPNEMPAKAKQKVVGLMVATKKTVVEGLVGMVRLWYLVITAAMFHRLYSVVPLISLKLQEDV